MRDNYSHNIRIKSRQKHRLDHEQAIFALTRKLNVQVVKVARRLTPPLISVNIDMEAMVFLSATNNRFNLKNC